ncbi:pyridine nucleotide transhydrogenase [candidate division WWE3 bacterium RIFCSPHIGHO2_01_FULL_42_13]|uniref:Pyridine nucleotide transhydrogenase n=1 Tax=candidate division WWE3 bacterium RIFCSPHIGHO2_01_FULL_42_13 TaxID=1802617 RepID=A0A1F4UT52_UNCKA|nr:MAG: pyridine nucleotide transhydrogenase [candidate division WWE3 bacterium RIFCSPHIGHO2_01_FULL_42_13]
MTNALIGFTGFVGSNILSQTKITKLYNSSNIEEIKNKKFDLVLCSGLRAEKWKANQNPQADIENIHVLMNSLETVKANKFIHISTVDVYPTPIGVNEDTLIDSSNLQPYGRHRYLFEEFVRGHFKNVCIIRLPGLFGKGIKKNFIYDLIHNNALDYTHKDSQFQFYDLSRIWHDIQIAINNHLPLVNIATPPISAEDLALTCFRIRFTNVTDKPPVRYDMHTKYAKLFQSQGNYLYSKRSILNGVKKFADENFHF